MTDLMSAILKACVCVWPFMSEHTDYVYKLEENLKSLEDEIDQLKLIYEDVKQKVKSEEKVPQMKRTKEVGGWLEKVEKMDIEVSKTLQDGGEQEQNKCLGGCCPKDFKSSYIFGKKVSKMLEEVKKLTDLGRFKAAVVQKVHEPVHKTPLDEPVGLDSTLQNVWRCIEDTTLGIIGLYGIAGVGKSTLLRKINNEFLQISHDFEEVILVSVSKKQDVEKIQQTIMVKLDIVWSPDSRETNAQKILQRLYGKKFLLLLDDLWENLDLNFVGIPPLNDINQSKVVFTTRSIEVCGFMKAQRKIEVQCLSRGIALQLFWMKVGKDTLKSDPVISKLAADMVEKCNGLPLALITVGGTMASRNNRDEWEFEIKVLRNTPSQFEGMDGVRLPLKFSFDRLQGQTHKSCFLYCCLFPEGYNIRKEELIEHWIGEGFLDDEASNINSDLRHIGESIIGCLKRACLLETGESEEFVRMHSMVRDMAWEECKEKIALLIKINEESRLGRWNEVERMSLWDYSIEDLLKIFSRRHSSIEDLLGNVSQLPNVRTMICKDPISTTLHARFFPLMSALRLLDLSNSSLLRALPTEIGNLINLEYLNLSGTAIPELPFELQKLTKLRCLILNYANRLQEIPTAMITKFQFLEVFSKLEIIQFRDPDNPVWSIQSLLEKLECLRNISEICIAIHDANSVERLLRSQKLLGCIRKLTVDDCSDLTALELSPSSMSKMEDLELRFCTGLLELNISHGTEYPRHHNFSKLRKVVIKGCNLLSDVRWLIYASELQTLELGLCESLRKIIGDELGVEEIQENLEIFSSLTVLRLNNLPSLESICGHALLLPSLIKIEVHDCPSLTKLPFDSNSARSSLKLIIGEQSWWRSLRWDDEAVKQFCSSKLVDRFDQTPRYEDFQLTY